MTQKQITKEDRLEFCRSALKAFNERDDLKYSDIATKLLETAKGNTKFKELNFAHTASSIPKWIKGTANPSPNVLSVIEETVRKNGLYYLMTDRLLGDAIANSDTIDALCGNYKIFIYKAPDNIQIRNFKIHILYSHNITFDEYEKKETYKKDPDSRNFSGGIYISNDKVYALAVHQPYSLVRLISLHFRLSLINNPEKMQLEGFLLSRDENGIPVSHKILLQKINPVNKDLLTISYRGNPITYSKLYTEKELSDIGIDYFKDKE
jgi:hypothetical protein